MESSMEVRVGPVEVTAAGLVGCGAAIVVILIISLTTKACPPFVF
ncbi:MULTISPECIES: hypothetical protein [Bradyrhizobium]|nr:MULTISPECIES: hypothetical protein [Bradyrhizobium]WLB34878.1 hypothetical protein QIH78_25690 [Bradyrhizobium diazoefficiens]